METGMLASQALASGFLTLAPLSAQHEGLGVLEITSERELSVEQHILLASLLRIYHSLQGLLDYGERDSLTNLLNRKTFDAAFLKRTMLGRIPEATDERRDPPRSSGHWLGVMDIDHFKKVNDNFGHLIGDEVLILVARLMRSTFRFDDLIYRFGGEEFAIIVNCNCEAHAEAAFNRFRVATQEHVFPQVGRITISLGFTALRPGDTPSAAFERADKAVYYAKSHGRNQVCNHAALVKSGEVTEVTDTHELEMF
jgi:diguanylate cyclase (GGDEF)-like protein